MSRLFITDLLHILFEVLCGVIWSVTSETWCAHRHKSYTIFHSFLGSFEQVHHLLFNGSNFIVLHFNYIKSASMWPPLFLLVSALVPCRCYTYCFLLGEKEVGEAFSQTSLPKRFILQVLSQRRSPAAGPPRTASHFGLD